MTTTTFADNLAAISPPAPAVGLVTKYYTADEVNFTPGERSFVAWVSTEQVDREGDVVVASGVDFKTEYLANPVVMAVHDYGRWPLGQCEWLKVKSGPQWRGLYGKANVDDDADAEVVWKKIQKRTVRGVSIGFQPAKGMKSAEWGPPTADELRKNPHWKGARRIIRRCVMIEFSVTPIGMNPSALIEAVSKGLHRPRYAEPVMSDDETTLDGDPVAKADDDAPEAAPDPVETKAAVVDPSADNDEDEPDDDEDDGPIRKGHYVNVVKGRHKGVVGKVASVHRAGLIPDVDDDVPTTKDDPGVRVKCYKAMGDGHKESEHHVGCKMAHVVKCDDLKPPARRKGLPDPVKLPPLVGKTDAELAAERLAEVRKALSPEAIKAIVERERDRALGAV